MTSYLLDTCLISELTRKRPNPDVTTWLASVDEHALFLSVITIGEIWKGIAKLSDSTRAEQFESWLESALKPRFASRLLPFDETAVKRWGIISGVAEREGKALPAIDAQIAAIALEHGLVVVTRNVKHFDLAGCQTLNPWKSE